MDRLGGEYRDANHDRTVWAARRTFLERLSDLAPDVMTELFCQVFPLYRSAIAATIPQATELPASSPFGAPVSHQGEPEWIHWKWTAGNWELDESVAQELHALRTALNRWAEGHHLDVGWLKDAALRQLWFWLLSPDTLERARLLPFVDNEILEDFTVQGWVPQWERWDSFIERVQAALKGYRETVERRSETAGLVRSPSKRGREGDEDATRHFDWLIIWNVLGKTKRAIAEEYGIGEGKVERDASQRFVRRDTGLSTITSGIDKAAKLIDLPVRMGRQGHSKPH